MSLSPCEQNLGNWARALLCTHTADLLSLRYLSHQVFIALSFILILPFPQLSLLRFSDVYNGIKWCFHTKVFFIWNFGNCGSRGCLVTRLLFLTSSACSEPFAMEMNLQWPVSVVKANMRLSKKHVYMENKRGPEHGVPSMKQNVHFLGGGTSLIFKAWADGNSSCLNLGPWKSSFKGVAS